MATAAEIAVLEADWIGVDAGVELLDADDVVLDDISDDLHAANSSVEHAIYATIHGTCTLDLSRPIEWGSQRLKPWMTVTNSAGGTVTRSLGVYIPTTPSRNPRETPQTYQIKGYDKLEVLNHPHGASFALEAGGPILDAVRQLITDAGETAINIDADKDASTQASTRLWPIDEGTFTIHIINDLLGAVGYRGLSCDGDGFYVSGPYSSPSDIAPMWAYDAQSASTSVGEDRIETADYFAASNRWVFMRDDPSGAIPIEGAGLYTVVNLFDGPTSYYARGERFITTIARLDSADQASLVVQGDRIVERDKRLDRRVELSVSPNPLHGHFDVVTYVDAELGPTANMLVTDWMLPLSGADMTLKLKGI